MTFPLPGSNFAYTRPLLYLKGGATITTATLENAIGDGYPGIFLDPRAKWTVNTLVLNGFSNFLIESRMGGSIGYNGVPIAPTGGYIACGNASGDGIQVYASNAGGNPTQGVIFKNVAIVGSNPGAACFHMGGGQRSCGLVDSYVQNLSAAAGSYAVVSDTQLANNNGEDLIMRFTGGGGLASGYAALGWGTNDQGQRSNDTEIWDLRTAGGTYGVFLSNGGGLTFHNWYDRSNPATAAFYNHGATRVTLIGGEDRNTVGLAHLVDNSNAQTLLINRAVSQSGTPTTTVQVSAGSFACQGGCVFNSAQTIALSGTGKVALDDPGINGANATISGAAGTVYVLNAAKYHTGAAPVTAGFTGTVNTQY